MSEQLVTPENVTTKDGKINLLDLNRQQMREFFKDLGEKPFRADQVMKWMYHYCCDNFDEMTDINKVLRGKLKEVAEIRAPEVVEEQRSSDGTIKWAIAVGDQRVETVYIPEDDRATLCVSSQVGCALECKFCSTAQQGFNRNLRVSEIIGQVWRAAKIVGAAKVTGQRPITNVVMMGMGEPLLNLNNVVPAMEIMLDDFGFGLSKRRVTLSTSGVVPALDKLGDMIDKKKELEYAKHCTEILGVACSSVFQNVGNLSGGNQQKVVISKYIDRNIRVLILDEPTRGIDVGAKDQIYEIIEGLAQQGMAVIVISSEIPELQLMCDRICVMSQGKVTTVIDRSEFADSDNILRNAIGI